LPFLSHHTGNASEEDEKPREKRARRERTDGEEGGEGVEGGENEEMSEEEDEEEDMMEMLGFGGFGSTKVKLYINFSHPGKFLKKHTMSHSHYFASATPPTGQARRREQSGSRRGCRGQAPQAPIQTVHEQKGRLQPTPAEN